ncbi:MAG: patatin-like phospholipase family protein [Spirochaetales bacterium]|nr:patatin-like phospholipase family protein [Spirochaetales bacterium]
MYPFENLVFRGGGVLGIAYLGAIEVLDSDKYKILPKIKRISGASAGAITALIVSICNSAEEIKEIADKLDFSKVPQKVGKELVDAQLHVNVINEHIEKATGLSLDPEDILCLLRLISKYGWYSSDYIYKWFKNTIQTQFDKKDMYKHSKGRQTFAQFKEAGFRDLYISVTDITNHCNKILSAENAPDMPVADAVRMSMSIPVFFESIKFDGDQYADGGTVNNYLMEVFDNEKYVSNPDNFKDGINNETLGCHLYSSNDSSGKEYKIGLLKYLIDLMKTLFATQEIEFSKTPNLVKRSANISDCGISAIDFDIKVGDPDYENLCKSGKKAMSEYLSNY